MLPWDRLDGLLVTCPHCRAREYMRATTAYAGAVRGRKLVEQKVGAGVVCLRCNKPFLITVLEPTGVVAKQPLGGPVIRHEFGGTPPKHATDKDLEDLLRPLPEP